MAGHIMAEVLEQTNQYNVYGIARQTGKYVDEVIDVTDFQSLEAYLKKINPEYVINCIGALVMQSKNNLSSSILLNSYLPNFLSQLGSVLDYKLIHISTDCVFSGKDGQYTETSFCDGDNSYARTKTLGEVINQKDLTIRTSIIGPELKKDGVGLLDWFFKQNGSINGYTKAYWSGVTTLELAKATNEMIDQNIVGLYQLCPSEKISKFCLLKIFEDTWNLNKVIIEDNNYSIDKSLVCTRTDFNYQTPNYRSMLNDLKKWMEEHEKYYAHYNINYFL